VSFNLDRLLGGGRLKRLHELLMVRHHADPNPAARARADIERMLNSVFEGLAQHYANVKGASLKKLVKLQGEAIDFYQHVLSSRGTPDVARLEKILREMDEEMATLTRKADDLSSAAPKPKVPGLGPPPPKAWDDPSLSVDEFIASYRSRYPDSPLTDKTLRQKFKAKERLNPETGQLKRPTWPLPPPEHADLPTDPRRIEAWKNYQRGGDQLPCFPAGTPVHVPGGVMRIEQLAIADEVFAWDGTTNRVRSRPIVRVHRNWTLELVLLETNRGPVYSTQGHRFWVPEVSEWVAAGSIRVGVRLASRKGEEVEVTSSSRVMAFESTYNLEVDVDHTFYVGDMGLLVHNENDSAYALRDNARETRVYRVIDDQGNVIYVGQTVHEDVEARLLEHINDPESALYIKRAKGSPQIELKDSRNKYRIYEIAKGKWTAYEAAVWEQHFIDYYGRKGTLLNRRSQISVEKFVLYRDLHNPC
jgi:Pretoxin HINT domain